MPSIRRVRSYLLLASAASLFASSANAQISETPLLDRLIQPSSAGGNTAFEPGVTVVTRARPQYDSSGITAGNFVIRPQIAESFGYQSNVLSTRQPQGSALISTLASLNITNDFDVSHVGGRFLVEDVRYPNLPKQNFTNWTAGIDGSHQFGQDTLAGSFTHLTLNETPGGLDTPTLVAPIPYNIDSGQLSYRANFSRTFLTPAIEVASYTFGSGAVPGSTYNQSYRDRVVVTPSVTAGYEFSPQRSAILVVRNSIANYTSRAAGQPRRDYNDTAVLAGIDYDVDAVIRYRVLAGYEARLFSASSTYKTIQAPIVEASAIWTPTGITTVTGTLARKIEDSADETTAGYTESFAQLRADHEYSPNILFRLNGGLYFTQYRNDVGNQTLYTAGAGATYLMNRNMQLELAYDFSGRISPGGISYGSLGTQNVLGGFGQSSNYKDNRIALTLRLRL